MNPWTTSREKSGTARLLIVDDHDLAREGLRSLLSGERNLSIVGEAANGSQALSLCARLAPDLVIMDVRMPDMDGLAATRAIKQQLPGTSVIIITIYENPDYLLEALKAGAAGYLLKGATRREVLTVVHRVLRGESVLEPDVASQLLKQLTNEGNGRAKAMLATLTRREVDVLRLVARGHTNQMIGQELALSVSTVKTHVEHILNKLGVSDRTQAAVRAAELGLLSVDEHGVGGRQ
jgi:DNA-binding NarL/FixJ family response regulator